MGNTIFGIFSDRSDADHAMDELENNGYSTKDITIVAKDEVVHKTDEGILQSATSSAAQGAVAGGAMAGIVGLLVGVGAIVIPGIGGLLIGGPLAAALGLTGAAATAVSAGATGAVAGGLLGGLVGIGLPHETAEYYERKVKEGGILVAVAETLPSEKRKAQQILQKHNADHVTWV
jgi:hypothetical protein